MKRRYPENLIKMQRPAPSEIYDTYWRFAAERQAIFFRRWERKPYPWTDDSILGTYKFTNAYRAADRVSQFLLREVIFDAEHSAGDLVLRILLFKIFNKTETWKLLERSFGSISMETFNPASFSKVLASAKAQGRRIYSGAYIMASGRQAFGHAAKHANHLDILDSELKKGLVEDILATDSMDALYRRLVQIPSFGSFLAYQYATDLNYSSLADFSEMSFVKAGPGARDGISKCFDSKGDYSDEDIIKLVADEQDLAFDRLGLSFQSLWGRKLQLIDCQNLFCEVDKYCRVAYPDAKGSSTRTRIKQKYYASKEPPLDYFFPPKWGINDLILSREKI